MSNFHALEVVGRGSDTQLQVRENLNYLRCLDIIKPILVQRLVFPDTGWVSTQQHWTSIKPQLDQRLVFVGKDWGELRGRHKTCVPCALHAATRRMSHDPRDLHLTYIGWWMSTGDRDPPLSSSPVPYSHSLWLWLWDQGYYNNWVLVSLVRPRTFLVRPCRQTPYLTTRGSTLYVRIWRL